MRKKKTFVCIAVLAISMLTGCGKTANVNWSKYSTYEHMASNTKTPTDDNTPTGNPETPDNKGNDGNTPTPTEAPEEIPENYDITIRLAGDINLDEDWATTKHLDSCVGGISDCFDSELLSLMQDADIFYLNNEFTYGTDTEKLPKKMYNFRANPERVKVLTELGVDAVSLANNHTYDYQADGLKETFRVLKEEGIPYFGAGNNITEAKKPLILTVQGKKIAFLNAMSEECDSVTVQATETSAGILRCSPGSEFTDVIRETKKEADFVIVCVHWGTEYTYDLLDSQIEEAKEYSDAGADLIIGAHSHVVQKIDFEGDTPIFYSLGNYWFNEKKLFTVLLEVHLWGDSEEQNVEFKIYPALQKDCETRLLTSDDSKKEFYDLVKYISRGGNAKISEDGTISKKN